jgi:hypothetical protein
MGLGAGQILLPLWLPLLSEPWLRHVSRNLHCELHGPSEGDATKSNNPRRRHRATEALTWVWSSAPTAHSLNLRSSLTLLKLPDLDPCYCESTFGDARQQVNLDARTRSPVRNKLLIFQNTFPGHCRCVKLGERGNFGQRLLRAGLSGPAERVGIYRG